MSGSCTNQGASGSSWCGPVEAWEPPLDHKALALVLEKARTWQPFDGGALLDDIADVFDGLMPQEEDLEELGQRLRGHLMRLVDIAVVAEADRRDEQAAQLIDRARTVRSQDMPGDHRQAVGHLRRMGWAANELLERLVASHCLKEAA